METVTVAAFLGAEVHHLSVDVACDTHGHRYVGSANGVFLEFAAGLNGRLPGRFMDAPPVGQVVYDNRSQEEKEQ
jgi:hypothetical protein